MFTTKLGTACFLFALGMLLRGAPAHAQVDFSGEWAPLYHEDGPERLPGPELGDYTELPINDAARMRADSYDADRISVVPEYQCRPHGADYSMRGLGNLRIWREYDQATQRLVAFHTHLLAWDSERTVYMDGRPHPPEYADHTWQGFSTGVWEGNMLTITTTHLKTNYLRRNGVPRSDKANFTEHWYRHGDYLTVVTVINDPVFLTEPLVRSDNWFLDPGQAIGVFGCEYAPEVPRPPGTVPHHLPGTNKFLAEFSEWYGLPYEATRGGAETLYPEYRAKMGKYNPPAKCERYCTCTTLFNCNVSPFPMKTFFVIAMRLGAQALLAQNASFNENELVKILPVQGNVYMLVGLDSTSNTTLQMGKDGVLVVDTQNSATAPRMMNAIRTLSEMPIKYIVNTGVDTDHTGGNGALAKLGGGGAMPRIIANDHVLNRMTAKPGPGQTAVPDADWPNDEYFGASKDFFFNNEAVMVYHLPAAHTDGDSIVFFRRSDVISTGDIFTPERYPLIDLPRGGTVQGIIDALNRIIEITVPAKYQEGGTYVIPGHGRLCEEADVVEYRDMVTIIRDRVADLIKKGRTLEQVKAAKPTLDYDTQYGATTGIWTTDMFIEAVYKNLSEKKQ